MTEARDGAAQITIEGPAIFLHGSEAPPIPIERGRDCPQCGVTAWARSRFCWNCAFDFEAACVARLHPVKLLFLSLLLNLLMFGALLVVTLGPYLRPAT